MLLEVDGSVEECLTWDPGVADSSLIEGTVFCLVLVQPR